MTLLLAVPAAAAPDFARALAAMDQGDYQTAVTIYEGAVEEGARNGDLFYNLGICYQRLKRPGEAVAAFLAARRYLPRDPDVGANLRFVLANVPDKLDTELDGGLMARMGFWIDRFTVREFAYASAAAFAMCGLVLLSATLLTRWRPWRPALAALLAVPMLLAVSAALRAASDHPWGAVAKPLAKVLSGPGASNTAIFELREGAPFAVLSGEVSDYWQIELSDGKKGWIARSETKVFAAR
jgi:tetratricopeptide (TPR) repeat protein